MGTDPTRDDRAVDDRVPDLDVPRDPRAAARLLADRLAAALGQLAVATRVAKTQAKDVAPTLDEEVTALIAQARPAAGDRRTIVHAAGRAEQALIDFHAAIDAARAVVAQAHAALEDRLAMLAAAETSVDIRMIESAQVIGEDIRKLQDPCADLESAVSDAARFNAAVGDACGRRIHAAAIAAVTSHVVDLTARLRRLEIQAADLHRAATDQPDAIIAATKQSIDRLAAATGATFTVPAIKWPVWSSAQSKHAKSSWTGNPFAVPTIEEP